jgi:hypothetical protein
MSIVFWNKKGGAYMRILPEEIRGSKKGDEKMPYTNPKLEALAKEADWLFDLVVGGLHGISKMMKEAGESSSETTTADFKAQVEDTRKALKGE